MHFYSIISVTAFVATGFAEVIAMKGEPVLHNRQPGAIAIVGEPVQVQVINGRADPPAASTVGGVGAPVQYTMVPTTITTGGITVVVSTPSVAIQTATATSKNTGAGAVTSTTAPGAAGRAMATPFIGTGGLVAAVGLAAALW